jgi:uncharacterized protein YbjT (DUF2867 family)
VARVLVTGGTGNLGRRLVPLLRTGGHDVTIMSRTAGPGRVVADLSRPATLAGALDRQQVVVHAASSGNPRLEHEGTEALATAAVAAGAGHFVYVSIVGVDRNPFPYYRAKHNAELAVAAAGGRHTCARGTQWFDLVAAIADKLHLGPIPFAPKGWRLAPSDVDEFARFLADTVDAEPVNGVVQFAGPQETTFAELAGRWHAAHGRPARVRQVPIPGRASRAFRTGAQLPDPAHPISTGRGTWAEWVAATGR